MVEDIRLDEVDRPRADLQPQPFRRHELQPAECHPVERAAERALRVRTRGEEFAEPLASPQDVVHAERLQADERRGLGGDVGGQGHECHRQPTDDVSGQRVRPPLEEQSADRIPAEEGDGMERRVAAAIPFINVGAGIEHCGHDCRIALERGAGKRRATVEIVAVRDGPLLGEPLAYGSLVAGEDLRDGGLRADRPLGKPLDRHVERHDRRDRDCQRQENPRASLLEQAPEPAAAEDEHREHAAQQEKERHSEAMHRHREEQQQIAAVRIVHWPGEGEKAQRGVQRDPQQHGEAAQGVEIGASLRHGNQPSVGVGRVSEHDGILPHFRYQRLEFRFPFWRNVSDPDGTMSRPPISDHP